MQDEQPITANVDEGTVVSMVEEMDISMEEEVENPASSVTAQVSETPTPPTPGDSETPTPPTPGASETPTPPTPAVAEGRQARAEMLERCYNDAQEVVALRIKTKDPGVLKSKQLLADILFEMGKFEEAEKILLQLEGNLPGDSENGPTFHCIRMLGRVQAALGEFQSAHLWFTKLFKNQKELNAPELELVKSRRVYGSVCMADGKHKKAQSFFEEVEKSRASVYLGGSVESLQFLTDFVRNSYKLGDFKAAEARQERIISGVKKLERQSITLSSHKAKHNLAEFKRRLGKLDEARSLHEANVKFLFEHVGVDHLDPLKAAERLGDTYFDLKMYEEAAEYYQGITENRGKLLGSEHVDTVSIREKLAVVRFKIVQESSEIGEFL